MSSITVMPQPLFTELPASAQTAYAQLLEASLGAAHLRSVADLPGSFNAKMVKGRKYWNARPIPAPRRRWRRSRE